MKTIMIVDDDININNLLNEALTKQGYRTIRAWSGTETLLLLEKEKPDLVLLDLMLPGLTGEHLLKELKNIPVIVVSAKADIENKIDLLERGAVDYVTKPFDLRELTARIKLRLKEKTQTAEDDIIRIGEIEIDSDSHFVYVNGNNVRLTRTEYAIFSLLCRNPNRVLTKAVILDRIYNDTPDCVESSLNVHICNIRKKLKAYSDVSYIESIWGIGYKLTVS